MTKLAWDQQGERFYETGVDHGVLYQLNTETNEYDSGVSWNGLISVTESPNGAESTPLYADNIQYLNLTSNEKFEGSIEAYTYPDEFAMNDGTVLVGGTSQGLSKNPIRIGQQDRKTFALAYRSRIGNDVVGDTLGYKLHFIWGAKAQPSEKQYQTVNESPEAITFNWSFTTTPLSMESVPKENVGNVELRPTAHIVVDSTKADPEKLKKLEELIYGTDQKDPVLPHPANIIAIIRGDGMYVKEKWDEKSASGRRGSDSSDS